MRSLNKKLLLTYIFLVFGQLIIAQQYKFRSSIDTVHQTGFYKIIISPELSAHCKTDFSDIRITDSSDQWVPYIIRSSFPYLYNTDFIELPIIKNELTDNGKSLLVIENSNTKNLYKLSLVIKNTTVSRFATLSGSNDKNHWFIIDEKILIGESYELTKDNYVQSLQFPVSNYRYFKLLINNAGTDPLDIEKIGFYVEANQPHYNYTDAPYLQNPLPISIKQKDSSDGKSYIKVICKYDFQFNNIKIGVQGPQFFSRKAVLYLPLNDSTNKPSPTPIAAFLIQANTSNTFDIAKQKAKIFYIVITNEDNPPLKISSIVTRQLQNEVVAYLEKDKRYSLLIDNPAAAQPDYDLEKFRDSISTTIDSIKFGVLLENKKPAPVVGATKTNNKTWLWIIISLAGLLLTFFTFRLSRDINKSGM